MQALGDRDRFDFLSANLNGTGPVLDFAKGTAAAAFWAAVYSLVVLLIPWEELRGAVLPDFWVYARTFEPGEQPLRETLSDPGLLVYFTREILWNDFVHGLVFLTGDSVLALQLISALVLWINAFILFRRYGYFFPALLLLNPIFLTFALSQLRLAFGIALLLIASEQRFPSVRLLLVVAAAFVHSTIPIFVGLYFVARWVDQNAAVITRQMLATVTALVVASLVFVLVFAREMILEAAGDRRVETYNEGWGTSLSYLSGWIMLTVLQLSAGEGYLKRIDNYFAFLINVLFLVLSAADFLGARFAAAAFPIIVAAALNLPLQQRMVFLPSFVVYQLLQFYYFFGYH